MMKHIIQLIIILFLTVGWSANVLAQTEMDAIMMNKKQFCNGPAYMYSSWDHYWEGKLNRTNENLGRVSTQSIMYMAAYGINGKLNVLAGVPYLWTKASAGTLHGSRGLQDLSLFLKWKPLSETIGTNKIAVFALFGFSTPLTNYQIDYLPLTIGLGTTNAIMRGMVDFQHKRFSVTGSAAYIRRSNVKIDRSSYYDTQAHLTNEVEIPDAAQYQLRAGYRGKYLLAEALLTNWTTLGGFDITRNNMPFPSNRMNATTIGFALKYTVRSYTHLSLIAGSNYTLAGRNMGQATSYNAGIFYAFYFKQRQQQ
ncbi:MAG TPA: hypothetical protein VFS36_08890 [Chitinophagaceae bacterium]|nr:hypothetical protein [Chitinophagaceae bacterium]